MSPKRLCGTCIVVSAIVVLCGCGAEFEIGPAQITFPLGSGSLSGPNFSKALVATVESDLCDLPSEAELKEELRNLVDTIDLTNLITLSRIEVVNTKITATSGNFNNLDQVSLEYVPKPVSGQEQPPVSLGSVSTPPQLGNQIVLTPPSTVDMLQLMRQNDDNAGPGCPKVKMTAEGTAPVTPISWQSEVTVNIWAKITPLGK